MTVRALAPAKINLTLHVTGQRADGYHLLDSLVAFADFGDEVAGTLASDLSLRIIGPFSAGLSADEDNLVARAALMMGGGASLVLDKRLPVASGIGGGSSDAAATLRVMAALSGGPMPELDQVLTLGADVPVCLAAHACRMQGIGQDISPRIALPPVHAVLVNPGVAVSTPAVFRALPDKNNAAMPDALPDWTTAVDFADWLATQRNDLQAPAQDQQPVIGQVLDVLTAADGCLLTRMSGSGATCFGLFAAPGPAMEARDQIRAAHPDWWVQAGRLS